MALANERQQFVVSERAAAQPQEPVGQDVELQEGIELA